MPSYSNEEINIYHEVRILWKQLTRKKTVNLLGKVQCFRSPRKRFFKKISHAFLIGITCYKTVSCSFCSFLCYVFSRYPQHYFLLTPSNLLKFSNLRNAFNSTIPQSFDWGSFDYNFNIQNKKLRLRNINLHKPASELKL